MNKYEEKAYTISEALPYIQRFSGKTIVVKYGGNAMVNDIMKNAVVSDCILLSLVGINTVLVHGGGPEISEMMSKVGKKAEFVNGLRVTDKETMDIAQMVLAGKVNKNLVNLLGTKGGKAIGISGMDGHLIEAKMKNEALGYVGEITKVNIEPIHDLLEKGYIPVVSTIGCDNEGNSYNINGDTAAAYIAGALQAERLIMMTDIAGLLRDVNDPNSLISEITVNEAKELYKEGVISGGMIPKVDCCIEAIYEGVKKVIIMDGRVPHSILVEILTNEGAGTMVVGDTND